ncbi:hypothetical protein PC121_g885 [Phytophthora cactorum]|nr:hypothetical protein PC120_g7194 [Phytophthora cactorum]KAG3103640.1 hypothetical protein PC121_g885 [Phytophthora cactorum]KAG4044507.1 hypothetical protein PC123_g20052 [Phytophthora cactorum]
MGGQYDTHCVTAFGIVREPSYIMKDDQYAITSTIPYDTTCTHIVEGLLRGNGDPTPLERMMTSTAPIFSKLCNSILTL